MRTFGITAWQGLTAVVALALLGAGVESRADYEPVWSEEFDGAEIAAGNWQAAAYPGVVSGSRERAHYTARPANVAVRNGQLCLSAKHEDYDNHEYTAARLSGYGRQSFKYGRVEARMKLPRGRGLRAWLSLRPVELTYGAWAASGEIVIAESTAEAPGLASGLFHGGAGPHRVFTANDLEPAAVADDDDFHVYAVEWQPYEIRWSIDGEQVAVQNSWSSAAAAYPAPFDQPFYLTLGLAVMEDVAGAGLSWPQELLVDWIRVYQARGNRPPQVEITSPADGSSHTEGAVLIAARASDPDGNLERVEFYNGNTRIGQAHGAPFELTWAAPDGCHTVVVRAVDVDGFACADSVDIECGRGCPPTPFHGRPGVIPGRIEAEDFDASVKGEAYFDTDPANNGGAYRLDCGVDVQPCSEGGFNIGWMIDGEWMQYTVEVLEAGRYDIRCRVGSPRDSARIHIEFDGVDKTGPLAVPMTGDWQRYTDLVLRDVELDAGVQRMRVFVERDGLNLDYIELRPSH